MSPQAMLTIGVAHALMRELGVAAPRALDISANVVADRSGSVKLSPIVALSIAVEPLRAQLADRLFAAVEVTPHRRRGRPPTLR